MKKELNDYMNVDKNILQSSYNIHDLQQNKAIKIYRDASSKLFGDLERPKKIWREIIYSKMMAFTTGLGFNFNHQMINNWEMMYSLGYFGGVSWGYWTSIALLQYYLDPRWIAYPTSPGFGRHDDYDEGILHKRIDGDAANLSNTSASGLMSVLLPEKLASFKMSFTKTRRVLERNGNKEALDTLNYLEIVANEMLRERLEDPKLHYYTKLTAMMRDYLDYGTCIALLEPCATDKHYDLTYIPFAESGLASTDYDVTQIGSWIQPIPLLNAYVNGFDDNSGTLKGFFNRCYLTGNQIDGADPSKFYELSQYTRNKSAVELIPHNIREIKRYKEYSPLLVARTNDRGQFYGLGAGLLALNSIVLANLYTNCSKLAAMGSFFPAYAFSNDSEVRQNNRTSGNYMSNQYTEIINAMPGSKLIVGSTPGVERSGMPPMTPMSKPPEQMQVFAEAANKCLESISSTYLVTLLDRLATIGQRRDVTAEQVMRQDNRDTQRFKSTIEPFYCSIVAPIVEASASTVIDELFAYYGEEISKINELDNRFMVSGGHCFRIDLFNYEQKQQASERMMNALQYAQTKRESGQEVPDEISGLIDKLIVNMIK